MIIGPRIMANTITIVSYSTHKPLLKLMMNDARNPVYHLVFMRRVWRASAALVYDPVNFGDLFQETIEDLNFTNLDTISVSFLSLLFLFFVFSPRGYTPTQDNWRVNHNTPQDTENT